MGWHIFCSNNPLFISVYKARIQTQPIRSELIGFSVVSEALQPTDIHLSNFVNHVRTAYRIYHDNWTSDSNTCTIYLYEYPLCSPRSQTGMTNCGFLESTLIQLANCQPCFSVNPITSFTRDLITVWSRAQHILCNHLLSSKSGLSLKLKENVLRNVFVLSWVGPISVAEQKWRYF